MNITEQSAQASKDQLGKSIDRLNHHLQDHEFLVGDQFTRADLAAVSLLAPLFRPEKYGLQWPEQIPERLESLTDGFHDQLGWAHEIYEKFR